MLSLRQRIFCRVAPSIHNEQGSPLYPSPLKLYVLTVWALLRDGLPWTALRFMTAKLWRPAWMAMSRYPLRTLELARLIPGAAGIALLCYVLVAKRDGTAFGYWAVGAGVVVATALVALSMALSMLTPKVWYAYFRTWRWLCARTLVLAALLALALLLAPPGRSGDTVAAVLAVWLCCNGMVEHLVESLLWQRRHRAGSSSLGIDRLTLTDDELRAVCIHEGGHLVMYGLMTRLPEDAFAMVDARPAFDFAGFVTAMNDVATIDMSVGLLRWNALVAFAGAAAEQVLLGRHTEGALADFGMADASVRRLAAIDHASRYCRMPVTEGEERTNAETLRALRVELFDEARRYLEANRALLIAVADHLQRHHSMDCEEFEPLWKKAVTPPGFTKIDPPGRIACLPLSDGHGDA